MISKRYIALFVLMGIILSSAFALRSLRKSAIVIDSISVDSEFRTRSLALLSRNGYHTIYVSGEEVTVEFFKNLPKKDLYILRVHSTCINNRTWIFTGEQYSPEKYPVLQLTDLIHRARTSINSSHYFCVSPEFIQEYNKDSFAGAIILMMGCEGLSVEDLAFAFYVEGASVYISWDGYVCLEHTDQAFLALIEALCDRNLTVSDSLIYAFGLVGSDPIYSSSLKYYPPEAGNRKVS